MADCVQNIDAQRLAQVGRVLKGLDIQVIPACAPSARALGAELRHSTRSGSITCLHKPGILIYERNVGKHILPRRTIFVSLFLAMSFRR
jgi:hypothetical protein